MSEDILSHLSEDILIQRQVDAVPGYWVSASHPGWPNVGYVNLTGISFDGFILEDGIRM